MKDFHASGNQATDIIIKGFKAYLVRLLIAANILALAIISTKNPFHGIRALKKVKRKRASVQGLPPVRKYVREGKRYFFSENIPGWPSSAFNGFIRAEVKRTLLQDNKAPLSTIIFAITSKCPLRCLHCYEWENLSSSDLLTFENLKKIIVKIKDNGLNHIQLSGGEPLERFEDLTNLIKFARKDADIWMLTSGLGLTYEKAYKLKKAGLTGADISLDHWSDIEHNRSRNNPKSFFWVREAVDNCRKSEIATSLSLCAFRDFVTNDNLIRYTELAKAWGVGFIRILEPRKAGRYKDKDIELGTHQIDLLERFFREVNSSAKYDDYPIITYPGYSQRRTGCSGAGNRYLYIDSIGNIHACPFCQESAGNAVSDSFEDAVSSLRTLGCQKFELNLTE